MSTSSPEAFLAELLSPTRRNIATLHPSDQPLSPTGSWLLGNCYHPKGFSLPPACHAKQWYAFAQINFADLPKGIDPDLPTEGILSFYFDDQAMMGLNFKHEGINGCGYLVVFHPQPDLQLHDAEASAQHAPKKDSKDDQLIDSEHYPLTTPTALSFEKSDQTLLPTDEATASQYPYVDSILTQQDNSEELQDLWYEQYQPEHSYSQVGGYAYFTQDDRREEEDWVMLLQLDTDDRFGMMWGDCGVGNFSIPRDALKQRDFSKIFFTWDCC